MNTNVNLTRTIQIVIFVAAYFFSAHIYADKPGHSPTYGVIELEKAISALPESAQKIIHDRRLLDKENRGIRIFRLYKPVPPHYHERSDTIVYLLEGEVSVAIDQKSPQRITAGTLLHWQRNTIHAIPEIHSGTATFFAIDVPKRDPSDAVFIDKENVEFLE